MSEIKIASLNVAGGLADAERRAKIIEGVKRMDADILFLSEAYTMFGSGPMPELLEGIGAERTHTAEYDDLRLHPDGKRQSIGVLSRGGVVLDTVRLGPRNAIQATASLDGEDVTIVGAHFDDRNETSRVGMAYAVLDLAPDAIIGDINALHYHDPLARLLGSTASRAIAAKMPENNHKLRRLKSFATRSTKMATGATLGVLESGGYVDADPSHRPIMMMGRGAVQLPIMQLDRVMTSSKLHPRNFELHDVGGTDHKGISVYVSLA